MTLKYKQYLLDFYDLSTHYCSRFYRFPAIYFLPIFHINRVHYSENFSSYCFSCGSILSRLVIALSVLPFKVLFILLSSFFYSFAYRRPSYSSFFPRRLFLSHFTKSNSDTLNHAFTAINCTDFDIHVVTSSLYDRTQFNRQIFIPDNSSTIYCRPYAKPFVELGYIFSSLLSVVRVLLELSRADSFVKKLFGSMLLLNYCHFVH